VAQVPPRSVSDGFEPCSAGEQMDTQREPAGGPDL
jgi:hypothetical protein